MMSLKYWLLTHSLTWNWSQRKMNWIVNFVNDAVETKTRSDYAGLENVMHMMCMGYWQGHHQHQLHMPFHQW